MTTSKIVAPALLSLLVGCATSEPIIVHKTVEVEVPVEVRCKVEYPKKPAWPLDTIPEGSDIYVVGSAALAEIELRSGYEGELEAALKRCADPK